MRKIYSFLKHFKYQTIIILISVGIVSWVLSCFFPKDSFIQETLFNVGIELFGGGLIALLLDIIFDDLLTDVNFRIVNGEIALIEINRKMKNAKNILNSRVASSDFESFMNTSQNVTDAYSKNTQDFPQSLAEEVNKNKFVSDICSYFGFKIYEKEIKDTIKEKYRNRYKYVVLNENIPFFNYTLLEYENNEMEVWFGWLLTSSESSIMEQDVFVTNDVHFTKKVKNFHEATVNQAKINNRFGDIKSHLNKMSTIYNKEYSEVRIYGFTLWRVRDFFEKDNVKIRTYKYLCYHIENPDSEQTKINTETEKNIDVFDKIIKQDSTRKKIGFAHESIPTEYFILFDKEILIHGLSSQSSTKLSVDVDISNATMYISNNDEDRKVIDNYFNHFESLCTNKRKI